MGTHGSHLSVKRSDTISEANRMQKSVARKVDDFSEVLLQYIKDNDGFTPLNDKTDAEVIYQTFGVSKKTFKKAVGDLYKKRLVVLEEGGIRLV